MQQWEIVARIIKYRIFHAGVQRFYAVDITGVYPTFLCTTMGTWHTWCLRENVGTRFFFEKNVKMCVLYLAQRKETLYII